MKVDQLLLVLYVQFVLACTIGAPLLALGGYLQEVRLGLCVMFLGGAILSAIGYWQYIPSGPRVSAFLALLMLKAVAFALLGVAFLVVSLAPDSEVVLTPYMLLTYALFAMAGASKLFTGAFVMLSAKRGWLTLDVYKFPWSKDRSED